jgi:spermidine synthase
LSGVPGLIDQVVWTREVGLVAGNQVEAVSVVVATFFSGLAIGAATFGRVADRVSSPLRLYGLLEIGSGIAAGLSTWPLRALGPGVWGWTGPVTLAASAAILLPIAVLLGGTLPALLRATASASASDRVPWQAGRIVGANTAGGVVGVAIAVIAIPELGLAATVRAAGAFAIAIGAVAVVLSRGDKRRGRSFEGTGAVVSAAPCALITAAIVGVATLGTEVLATRLAMLRLGSSLYAWGLVLGVFLVGLAAGNSAFAGLAQRTNRPGAMLGWLEMATSMVLLASLTALRPDLAVHAEGITPESLAWVAATVGAPAFLMGGAFPLLVRLTVRGRSVGTEFGLVSAFNTGGGIAGALLVPFALLPAFGSLGSTCALAGASAVVGWLWIGSDTRNSTRNRVVWAVAFAVAVTWVSLPRPPTEAPWILFVEEGAQSTVVVTSSIGDRTLWVDGDPEASTAGDARRTEVFLAALPLLRHPNPAAYLEVGLGSGITFGTASRFGLDRLECVEIAQPVVRAVRLFEPDNRGAAQRATDIFHADARVFLARHPGRYDVISANTLHPWSVGAGGLYSREYFGRIAAALRPGGLVVQWLPVERIGRDSVALVIATFFAVFQHGEVLWGPGNLILLGADAELAPVDFNEMERRLSNAGLLWSDLGLEGPRDLRARRIASAETARDLLSDVRPLTDDRPVLEQRAASFGGGERRHAGVFALLAKLATADGSGADPGTQLWLESLEARLLGDPERADGRERLAASAGFSAANQARAVRLVERGFREFSDGNIAAARAQFHEALKLDSRSARARLGLAGLATRRGDLAAARGYLEALVDDHPSHAAAWNELAGVRVELGENRGARAAVERALQANPYYPEALATAGLMAWEAGDRPSAKGYLARLRKLGPTGASPPERILAEALR